MAEAPETGESGSRRAERVVRRDAGVLTQAAGPSRHLRQLAILFEVELPQGFPAQRESLHLGLLFHGVSPFPLRGLFRNSDFLLAKCGAKRAQGQRGGAGGAFSWTGTGAGYTLLDVLSLRRPAVQPRALWG